MKYENWLNNVAAPDDSVCRFVEYFDHYNQKKAIAAQFAATADIVAEIGVRTGYSAHSFLSAIRPSVYVGYDTFGPYGEWRGGKDVAERILHRDFPDVKIHLIQCDSQKMQQCHLGDVGLKDVGFFHVDGDHSHDGCFHDLRLAWASLRSDGVLLVDDYDWVSDVRTAIDRFIYYKADEIKHREYFKTFRGEMVIVKR